MATHSLPSQAFHGASVVDRIAAVVGRIGKWLRVAFADLTVRLDALKARHRA